MGDIASPAHAVASIPRSALLQHWSAQSWSDGVRIPDLSAFDRLILHTRNSVYQIIVVAPAACEVLIEGGAFFPAFVRARISGSSLRGSFLKLHSVHRGFCLEVVPQGGAVIITTRVRALTVSPAAALLQQMAVM
jgi:hypothetical protein